MTENKNVCLERESQCLSEESSILAGQFICQSSNKLILLASSPLTILVCFQNESVTTSQNIMEETEKGVF